MANPTLVELFQDIADEIREKRKDLETTDLLVAANFPEEIRKIVTDPSGDVTATASDILYGKTACISGDGSITTGTMPNNGAVSKVLTTQNSYYTIPKGYHDGTGKVTATLTGAVLTSSVSLSSTSVSSSLTSTTSTFSSIINAAKSVGTTTVPSSGVYVKVIHKPAITSVSATPSAGVSEEGYVSTSSSNTGTAKSVTIKAASDLYIPIITSSATTPTTTITKEPSITLSSGSIKASYTGGQNITPTVPNAGWVASGTAGYVTTTGTKTLVLTEDNLVTLAGEASVKSGTGTITVGAPEYDSTNTNFTVSASLAIPAPSVESEGYISDNKGTKTANSASGSLTLAKVGLGATINNGGASTPVISRTAKPTDDTWVDAASGAVTTTKPTSGPYVQVDVVAATKTITATPKVSSDGYGTKSYYSSSNTSTTGGHNKADTAYIPITVATTQPTLSGATTTWSTGWVTEGKTVVPTATTAAGVLSLSPNGTQTSAPTKNSDGKYQFSATANMTATSVGTGYVTSKTITSADSKGVTFTMDAATLSSSVTHAKGTPTITTYTAAATGYTNAVESATLETSAPSSGVYAKVNVSGSLTSGSVKHSIGKAGYAPTSLTDTQTVTATINSTDRYIKIKEGSISRGTLSLSSGTGTITTAPTLSGSNYIFKTTATLTNTTVGAGWLPASTSGSDSQSVTFSMPKAIVTVKPASGNIQPTLSRGSKGTSETWTNADDTSGSVILNGTTPTSGVYIKVYSESNSAKQAGTAGYTNTVGYTPAVTSTSGKVDVTTNLQSSVLYVPVTTGTITSGSLSLANATSSGSLTVPSQSGSSYVFKATATLTAPKVSKAGWLTTQTITSGSNDSITFTMPTAVISNSDSTAAKVSATLTPASKDSSSTETWVDAYNSSGTITTNTAPTDKTPYIKISAGGTQTAGTGYYYVSTAGYTPKTSNKSISVNASVTGITKYIPIKTSSITLPSSLSKKPTITSHSIDSSTGTVTATFSNSGTVAVATSMSAAGWVASAPSGNVSISGTNTSKLELGIASVTVNPVSGTIKPTLSRGTKGSSETWTDASDTTDTYTSAPSSGVYVKVYSTANSSITAGSANYTNTAGYITAHTSSQGSKTVTANLQSAYIYVPVATATVNNSCTITGNTVTPGTIKKNSNNGIDVPITATGTGTVAISLSRSAGGWVKSVTGGSASATISNTVTLSTSTLQSIESGLAAGNIRSGYSIFGVTGTFTSDATATEAQILTGKIAYVNGSKVTGTMPNNGAVSEVLTAQDSYYTIPKGYHDGTGKVTATLTDAVLTSDVSVPVSTVTSSLVATTGTVSNIVNAAKNSGTTSPTSGGVYVKVTHTPTYSSISVKPSAGVSKEGYVSTSSSNTGTEKSITIKAASALYVPIQPGAVTTSTTAQTLNPNKPTFSVSGNAITATAENDGNVSILPSVTTSGWVTSNDVTVASVPISGSSSNTYTVTALTAGVVKKGTTILGVTGTYTSDATATADDIFLNKTAYVNGSKVTGTMPNNAGWSSSLSNATQSVTIPKGYHDGTKTVTASYPVIKLDATASFSSGTSTITPTFKQASKGSSESWYDAINSSLSIVESAPTAAVPYVKVTMTGGSSTVKATPSVNTEGYGSKATGGSTIGTAGTKTVTVGNKDLYIPIKVGSITVGSPTITLTASNSAFTLSKGNIKFTPNSAATGTVSASFTKGWIESQPSSGKITVSGTVSKDLTASDLTTLAGTATLGVNTSGGTLDPVLYTTTSAFTTGTNAASGAVETSPASSGVYAKVSIDATTISNSATPKITGAGYIGVTDGTKSTFNSTVNAKTVYVPIATTTVTNSCTIIGTSVALNTSISKNSNNGISVPVKATGSGSVTISLSRSAGGWVSSVTGGSASATITGTLNLTTSQLQGIESGLAAGNIRSGYSIFGVTGTFTSDATATKDDIFSGKTAYVNGSKVTGTLVSPVSTKNTFLQKNYFTYASAVDSASTEGTITIGSSSVVAGLVAYSGIKGEKVYNAVWNDLADLIPVDQDCELEFGKCYCFDGEKYYKSTKYLDDGIIGIHSDVAGFEMGHKKDAKELKCSVAGFVLAYVDKEYPVGTLLTCTGGGYLTEIKKEDKINYPEKIVGSYWKDEKEEYWGSEQRKVLVNGRKWIKVR